MFNTTVGMSQKHNAIDAIREALESALVKLETKPNLVLLFCTIHYDVGSELIKSIEEAKNIVGKNCILLGGTVGGFMCRDGVFSKGVVCQAIYSDEAKFMPVIAHKTKSSPEKVADEITNQLNSHNSKNFKNKILIDFIPGPTIPRLPVVNAVNFVHSEVLGNILTIVGLKISEILGSGIARDDIFLTEIKKKTPEYNIIGGATMDDGKLIKNFQFFDGKVFNDAFVGVCVYTNNTTNIGGTLEMERTNTIFNVTKTSQDGTILEEIDSTPAYEFIRKKLNLSDTFFKKLHLLYRTTLYYPISTSEDIESSTIIGAIYGNKLLLGHKLKSNKIELLSATGRRILDTPSSLKSILSKKSNWIFASACETGFEAIGSKIYRQKSAIDDIVDEKDYLIAYFSGEHYSAPNGKINVRSHSFNLITVD